MERTSTTQEPAGHRSRHLVAYFVGMILLTNVLTVLFVFMLRDAASGPVILQRVRPGAGDAPPVVQAQVETRQVRVTSRPAGAVVTHQGQPQGTTPLSVALPAHVAGALALEKDGYVTRAVTVAPDQTEVHVRLVRDRRSPRRDAARPGQAGAQAGAGQGADPATPAPIRARQAGDKPGDKPGDRPGDKPGDRPGTDRSADPAAPEPTRADPPADPPGAGEGAAPASPKPAAPEPARSGARRSRAQGDPAVSRENGARASAAVNPDS